MSSRSIPSAYALCTGSSEGLTPLNAFDGALIDAGIGNTNLVKVSSIIPPNAVEKTVDDLILPPGALLPVAYAAMESDIPGSIISAAVAAAWCDDPSRPGVLMEYRCNGHKEDAEAVSRRMAEAGIEQRGWQLDRIQSVAIDSRVEKIGAVFAGVVLWYNAR